MDIICFFNCVSTPANIRIASVALALTFMSMAGYRFSKSHKTRIRLLYISIALIPFALTFILGNFTCSSNMFCPSNIINWMGYAVLASVSSLAIVYYFFGPQLVLRAMKGTVMKAEDFPKIHRQLRTICSKLDVKVPILAHIESGAPKAFSVAGSKNIVILSVGALELLNTAELKAVLAHEIAHLKSNDSWTKFILKLLGFSYVYGFRLAQNLEAEQEIAANKAAETIAGKAHLKSAMQKFGF